MSPEDVPAELVEAAARKVTDYLHGSGEWIPPQHRQVALEALAAVLPLYGAQVLERHLANYDGKRPSYGDSNAAFSTLGEMSVEAARARKEATP